MGSVGKGEAILRQLSGNGDGGEGSKRWGKRKGGGNGYGNGNGGGGVVVGKKRVMVVIDHSTGAKHAMMWALTHVTNKGDLLTLLHVLPHHHHHHHTSRGGGGGDAPLLANSLGSLCKACKPEVEVEALVIQGPKLATVLSQVRKLEASVLVLSQTKPSPFPCLIRSSREEFVEECINKADCLTLAVRKQSKGVGGYLVSTRWQKNFWLLA
ncbi:uncharacterized protein LOC109708124 [Ananas comosus]|uniref:Uncharacterized protein LOC109708124 n=1 Tax=Ananas comosus TaxID=4615 RepID=A0A6P5EP75_ANACO|nr:uncharacterized protein LOC109708124 [Ananas comosus]